MRLRRPVGLAGAAVAVAAAGGLVLGYVEHQDPAGAGAPLNSALHASAPAVRPSAPPSASPSTDPSSSAGSSSLGSSSATLGHLNQAAGRTPVRLRVPAIGVATRVIPVGTRSDGQLDVADDIRLVNWWQYGARPGDPGTAVLAGHVDGGGREGVFWRLDRLRPGDRVLVAGRNGHRTTFSVISRRRVAKPLLPTRALFGRHAGPARLVLITCGGSFDHATGHYRDNWVVVADAV